MPSCNSYPGARQPSSATVTYPKATRRIRKPKRAVHRSLAAYGLYSTDCGLARRTRWPVRIIRKWIAWGHIRPVLYKGKLYYSLKRFREFVAHSFSEMAGDERVPGEVVRGPAGVRSSEKDPPEGGAAPLLNGYNGPCNRRGVNPLTT